MSKADKSSFEVFNEWPPSLRETVNLLGGNPFGLLVLATMYTHHDEKFTSTTLRKRFIEKAGTEDGVPRECSFFDVMKRLASGPEPFISTDKRQWGTKSQISRRGQEQGAAYAGPVLWFCLENRELRSQDIIGAKRTKTSDNSVPAANASASHRIGLYSLLMDAEGALTTTEISAALNIEKIPCNRLIRPLGQLGVLDVDKDVGHQFEPFSVSVNNEYRDPLNALTGGINALTEPGGIVDGLDLAEAALKDPNDFAYLMSIRNSQVLGQRERA